MYRIEAESIIKDYETFTADLDKFITNLDIKIISKNETTIEFDILNCHPSIANALRRALISMVPTMAIHNVFIYENTTVFPDEYIAHRLGLVPLLVNPEYFKNFNDDECYDTVLNFNLKKINNSNEVINVMSDDIQFVPIDYQEHLVINVKPGVLICKLAPKNEIEIKFKAIKGVGEQHAKWSPVSLCSYRIMPKIVLCTNFYGSDALELQSYFSPGVIEIVNNMAVVSNPRLEMMSREVLRHDKFKDNVKLLRESGWFCFTVESTALDPLILLKMALNVLIASGQELKKEIETISENYRND